MPAILERLPHGSRILLVRLRSLGDCVLTTPAITLLHQFRPDLQIGVVTEDRFAAVFTGNPAIASILAPSYKQVATYRPALVVNLHGGGRSAVLTLVSAARWRAGFDHFHHRWVYNILVPRAQEILGQERTVHTAEHLASAMFYLGVPRAEIPRARLFAAPSPIRTPYAIVHPLASSANKTWPASRFLEIAAVLTHDWQLDPIFIGGPGEDLRAFSAYRCVSGLALEEVKSLIGGASLFVGNDSGPAHMAAAFGLPVVVLFGPSDPVIWAPWRTLSEAILADGELADVPVSRVISALEGLRART
jgi:heptosyltransferase III